MGADLAAVGVSHRFSDVLALDAVTATFAAGAVHALLGPNGAGKTTLLRVLAGVLEPTGGGVTLLGAPLPPVPSRHARIAWVAQHPQLDPDMTVGETLALMAALVGARPEAAKAAAARFELDPGKRVRACSGGQRRRLHVAASLLHDPDILVLDEPFVGLDADARAILRAALRDSAARGCGVVLATHDLAAVEQSVDRVVVMRGGGVLDQGSPAELAARHGFAGVEVSTVAPLEPGAVPEAEAVPGGLLLRGSEAGEAVAAVRAAGGEPASVVVLRPGLETAYRALVGPRGGRRDGGGGGPRGAGGGGRRGRR